MGRRPTLPYGQIQPPFRTGGFPYARPAAAVAGGGTVVAEAALIVVVVAAQQQEEEEVGEGDWEE